ncbi:MAG: ABC transporter substrate-binding protein [Chloroflexi bacterium]|nr:ABC transporter substrate-binding protein [Chloroflexota bacterium]
MRSTIGRRRLLMVLAGASLGLAACSSSQPAAPAKPAEPAAPAKPAEQKPAAAAPAAASPVAAGASPGAAASPGTGPAASGGAARPAGTVAGGTFVIASIGPLPRTVHPYPNSADYSSGWVEVAKLIYGGGLLDQDANSLEYVPYSVKEWSVSPDGKTFTFKLRDDLKWSDGKPIIVDDYLFAYQEAVKEENDFVGLEDLERIESFTSPGPGTLVVTLKELLAKDVAIGVATGVSPVPKHVWQGKSWTDGVANPEILKPTVVSGAYLLKELNTAEGATFERNPSWFKGQANFEKIVIKPGQQPTVAYELLKSNQAQWAPAIPPSQYTEAKQNPQLNMYEWSPANGLYRVLEFNLKHELLKDKKVREALARTISREDLIQVAENGLGQPQYSFLNPANTKWYNPNVEKYEFDLSKSKSLLQEAGFKLNGSALAGPNGQPVRLGVLYPVSSTPRGKIAAYLQQQWKQLGIEVEVKGLDANAYFEEAKKKNFDVSLGSWGGGSIDPDLSSKGQILSTGQQNVTSFASEKVDQLVKAASVELDDAKRKQMYFDLQKLVVDELPSMYLYSATSFSPMTKKVLGVQPTKFDSLDVNDGLTRWAYAQ